MSVVTYQRESFSNCFSDAVELLKAHYEEIAWRKDKIKLHVDVDRYRAWDKAGVLRVYTARVQGELVGYYASILGTNAHYKDVLVASNDVVFVSAEERGIIGIRLLKFAEAALATEGAHVVILRVKRYNLTGAPVAKRLGYEPTDMVFQKWTGD